MARASAFNQTCVVAFHETTSSFQSIGVAISGEVKMISLVPEDWVNWEKSSSAMKAVLMGAARRGVEQPVSTAVANANNTNKMNNRAIIYSRHLECGGKAKRRHRFRSTSN